MQAACSLEENLSEIHGNGGLMRLVPDMPCCPLPQAQGPFVSCPERRPILAPPIPVVPPSPSPLLFSALRHGFLYPTWSNTPTSWVPKGKTSLPWCLGTSGVTVVPGQLVSLTSPTGRARGCSEPCVPGCIGLGAVAGAAGLAQGQSSGEKDTTDGRAGFSGHEECMWHVGLAPPVGKACDRGLR